MSGLASGRGGGPSTRKNEEREEPQSEWVYLVGFDVPSRYRVEVDFFLQENAPWGWEEDPGEQGTVKVYCPEREQAVSLRARLLQAFPDLCVQVREERKLLWHQVWRDFFQPFVVAGTFYVLPEWESQAGASPDLIPLLIYPEMAFGTGHHPTTHLCLEALAELREKINPAPSRRCLDLGTGSGILGIASAKTGFYSVGVDTDRVAVHNAQTNRQINGEASRLSLVVGNLDCVHPNAEFDLVLANIMAEPLQEMASTLVERLASGGYLVLSGLLNSQESEIERAYSGLGLASQSVLRKAEWSAMIWRKD